MDKATIVSNLHEMADHHLLGAGAWPADSEGVFAFRKTVREFGLEEDVPGTSESVRNTALGNELNLQLMAAFVGAHNLLEIPMILESNGYLLEQDIDVLYAVPEEKFERLLREHVLNAYLKLCNHSKLLN